MTIGEYEEIKVNRLRSKIAEAREDASIAESRLAQRDALIQKWVDEGRISADEFELN